MSNPSTLAGLGLMAASILTVRPLTASDEASPDNGLAKAVHTESTQPGSIESALHIRKVSGTVELNAKVSRATLTIDLYRDGKKVATDSQRVGLLPDQAVREGRFSVQVIDLDYLPLGGGKKGHCRILSALTLGTLTSEKAWDVPKETFGGSMSGYGYQQFGPEASSANEAPLFAMTLDTRPDETNKTGIATGKTVEDVVKLNRLNDLLIAKLVIDRPRDR